MNITKLGTMAKPMTQLDFSKLEIFKGLMVKYLP
jgi:hypothetical protein